MKLNVKHHMKLDISVLFARCQWYMVAPFACDAKLFGVEKVNDDIKQS
jgi:hypothetical protein